MKLLGRTNGKQVIASISRHDYVSVGEGEDRIADDGGALNTNCYAGYSRGWGKRIWFEVPQTFADLYTDYQFNLKNRKYGVWNIEDVRVLEEVEYPKADSFEEFVENAVWGSRGVNGDQPLKYVLLKDCSIDHLKAILSNVSHISAETKKAIKYLIEQKCQTNF